METLTAIRRLDGCYHLVDSRNNVISRNTLDTHIQFCRESGYRLCVDDGGKISWPKLEAK